MEKKTYSTYLCIGVMKLNETFDLYDSQLECAHMLMNEDGQVLAEVDEVTSRYNDIRDFFDFLAKAFAEKYNLNLNIIRTLLSSAYEKENDSILLNGELILGVDVDNVEDLNTEVTQGSVGIMIQKIDNETFECSGNLIMTQGETCGAIREIMGISTWDGLPTVAFYQT
jgi:hypothetical protein